MNDATDLSLEADRIEELFEAPVATPPVVMIEYRNRGVPWWLLGSILVLVPSVVGAIFFSQHLALERERAKAAKAEYKQKVQEVEQAAATKPVAPSATPVSILANIADPAVLHSVGPAENGGTAKAETPPSAAPTKAANVELGAADAVSPPAGVDEPSRSNVRSMTRSPFDSDEDLPTANGVGAGPVTAAQKAPGDPSGAKVATTPKDARAGDKAAASTEAKAGPQSPRSPAAQSPDAAVAKTGGEGAAHGPMPDVAPLPNAEEFLNQATEEAAKKEHELVEQERANAERSRVAMNENRVKFHDELREILSLHGKAAGPEIDELVRRSHKAHDPRAFSRAKSVWRQVRMTQQAKVSQIRALDISESTILDFISNNLYARMRSPGGPRDENEVRVRAAQILLSNKLPGEKESPESTASDPKDLKERGTGVAGRQ